jgi:uncharacterized protein (DUF362 family)
MSSYYYTDLILQNRNTEIIKKLISSPSIVELFTIDTKQKFCLFMGLKETIGFIAQALKVKIKSFVCITAKLQHFFVPLHLQY